MKRAISLIFLLGSMSVAADAAGNDSAASALRLLLSEVQTGASVGQQYCLLVFEDHHFHAERAHIRMGKDVDRKVYQGQLSDADWNALLGIIDAKAFRDLRVPPGNAPLVLTDPHPYTISVARESQFQNMEFLTKESLKPYEPQVKPLLQWWKSVRDMHLPESPEPADSRCTLNNNNAVLSN
jgi:hypothetical protein